MSCDVTRDGAAVTDKPTTFTCWIWPGAEGVTWVNVSCNGEFVTNVPIHFLECVGGLTSFADKALTKLLMDGNLWSWKRLGIPARVTWAMSTLRGERARNVPWYRRKWRMLPLPGEHQKGRNEDITFVLTQDKSDLTPQQQRTLEVGEVQAAQETHHQLTQERDEAIAESWAMFNALVNDADLRQWCLDPSRCCSIEVKGARPMYNAHPEDISYGDAMYGNCFYFGSSCEEEERSETVPVGVVCRWFGVNPEMIQWLYFNSEVGTTEYRKQLVTELLGFKSLAWYRRSGSDGELYHQVTIRLPEDHVYADCEEWTRRWQESVS